MDSTELKIGASCCPSCANEWKDLFEAEGKVTELGERINKECEGLLSSSQTGIELSHEKPLEKYPENKCPNSLNFHYGINYQRRVFNSLQEFHAAWISLINKQDVETTIVVPDVVPVPDENNAPIYGEVDNVFCRTTVQQTTF
jgi:hypothetical protein